MKQKKNPRFRFSGSIDMEIIRRQVKRHRRSVLGQWTIRIVVAAMIVTGTYLVIENQTYTSVATADSHKKDTEDSNQYIAFSDGVIRYSRDGVVFLNKRNTEKRLIQGIDQEDVKICRKVLVQMIQNLAENKKENKEEDENDE